MCVISGFISWDIRSSEQLFITDLYLVTGVSKQPISSIFKIKQWTSSWTAWGLETGKTGSTETSVPYYQSTLRNVPEGDVLEDKSKIVFTQ